jgi:hypothetical protein
MSKRMNILVACEESQIVTKKLRDLGHTAYSCDLLPCSGGNPEWHIQGDVSKLLKKKNVSFSTVKGGKRILKKGWHMLIAHPPCTYLASSGAKWFYDPKDRDLPIEERGPHPRYPSRRKDQEDALAFIDLLMDAPIEKIALENPVGAISSKVRRPDQIIQPYMFGDAATKTTCLWLQGLPLLSPTAKGDVDKGERIVFKSGKSQPKWYSDALSNAKTAAERQTLRSKTFEGIAEAFAYQWAGLCWWQEKPKWLKKHKMVKPVKLLF